MLGTDKRKRTAKRRNATYKGYKVKQWQTERKEQLHLIRDMDRTNLNTKMQPDKDIYISTGQILNQNFWESQKKMQKHIYCVQMIGLDAHCFNEDIKVQIFRLTLLGEARLCYHSLEPLGETTWAQLQNLFRQRYSKLGNTCKQLFHAWRSFTFDENTETRDSYVIRIRQVATRLGYGEPQILEVFKNFTDKTILDSVPYRRPQTSCRHGKENTD